MNTDFKIKINDSTMLSNDIDKLLGIVSNLESAKVSLNYILDELNEYWSANQEDQKVFGNNLEYIITYFGNINSLLKEFCTVMKDYLSALKQIQANDGGIS